MKEVGAHEEDLAAWKQQFKAEALRQIGERERWLAGWQAQLEAKSAELVALQADMEVRICSASFPSYSLVGTRDCMIF